MNSSCNFHLPETKDFVELLFTTLENGSYEPNRPKTITQAASLAAAPSGGSLDARKSRSPERQLSSTSAPKAAVKSDTVAAEPVARSAIAVVTAHLARNDRSELSRTKSMSDRRSRSRDRGLVSQLGSRVHRKMSRNEVNILGV